MESLDVIPSVLGKSKYNCSHEVSSFYDISSSKNDDEINIYAEMQATAFIKSLQEKYKQQKIDRDINTLEESHQNLQNQELQNLKEKTSILKSVTNDFNTATMIQTLFDIVINLKYNIHKDIFVDIGKSFVKTKEDCTKWSIFIFGGKAYLNSENKYEIDTSKWTLKNMDLPLERVNKMLDEHNIILENRANINRPFYVNLWALKKN
jgi:uncharacterized protein YdcH (DUF465 family)